MKNDDPIGWSADDYVPNDHILSEDELTSLKLEWFKKGMAVLTDAGNPDRETSLSNLCKMADSGLIGPLKKEEQE